MTDKQVRLCERLKRLGFTRQNHMRLYGEQFEFLSETLVADERAVFLDAIEKRSGQTRRIRIPLNVVAMAVNDQVAA